MPLAFQLWDFQIWLKWGMLFLRWGATSICGNCNGQGRSKKFTQPSQFWLFVQLIPMVSLKHKFFIIVVGILQNLYSGSSGSLDESAMVALRWLFYTPAGASWKQVTFLPTMLQGCTPRSSKTSCIEGCSSQLFTAGSNGLVSRSL